MSNSNALREFIEENYNNAQPPFLDGSREAERQYLWDHEWQMAHTLEVVHQLGRLSNVLDIGPTPFTEYLARRLPESSFYALDVTDLLSQRLSTSGIELKCCDLDADSLPFADNSLSLIVFTEVLEHIFRKPSEILDEMLRVLEPGGTLYISVPNIAALHRRLRLLAGRSPLEDPDSKFRRGGTHGHGHLHEYTLRELVTKLQGVGFKIEKRGWIRPGVRDCFAYRNRRITRSVYAVTQKVWRPWGNVVWCQAVKPS